MSKARAPWPLYKKAQFPNMASALPDEVVGQITSSLELFPGLRATPQKLQLLLDSIAKRHVVLGGGPEAAPKHGVVLSVSGPKKSQRIYLIVKHP